MAEILSYGDVTSMDSSPDSDMVENKVILFNLKISTIPKTQIYINISFEISGKNELRNRNDTDRMAFMPYIWQQNP